MDTVILDTRTWRDMSRFCPAPKVRATRDGQGHNPIGVSGLSRCPVRLQKNHSAIKPKTVSNIIRTHSCEPAVVHQHTLHIYSTYDNISLDMYPSPRVSITRYTFNYSRSNMPRGGARPGAGRKPGGRTKLTRESVRLAQELGVTPLAILLGIAGDERQSVSVRLAAASAAAPYVHAKLSAALVQFVPPPLQDGNGNNLSLVAKLDRLAASLLARSRDGSMPTIGQDYAPQPHNEGESDGHH